MARAVGRGHAAPMTNETKPPLEPPGPVPAAPRRLVRLREGRIIAGVGAGVARHLNVDPWLVRIVLLVLVAVGGVGLLLYLAGWALLSEEGASRSAAETWLAGLKGSTAWMGVGLIVVAGIWIAAATDLISGGLAWAVALLAVGLLLYQGRLPGGGPEASGGPSSGEQKPASESRASVGASAESSTGATVAVAPAAFPAVVIGTGETPAAPRARSFLGRITLGTLFVTLGVMALLDVAGATRPALRHYLVAAVLVVGLGLLVGSFVGRGRALIVLGLLLLPALVASVAVTAPFSGGFGERSYRPLATDEVQGPYRLAAGEMTLDLREIKLAPGEVLELEASVGAGRLLVLIPDGIGLQVTGHAGFGQVALLGPTGDGIDVDRYLTAEGAGTLVLDLDVGFGQVDLATSADRVGDEPQGLSRAPRG